MTKHNEPDREAARYRPLSSKESRDANCLRFNSHDDALDFARKSVQDSKNWLSAHNVSFADEYVKGYAEVHVKIPSFGYPGKLKLVAQVSHLVYPKDISGIHSDIHGSIPIVNNPVFAEGNEVHDSLVFCGTSEARGTPKKAIPSVVWLECFYEFGDLKGDAFTSSLDLPVDFIPILGEWKLKGADLSHSQHSTAITNSLVERMTQICKDATRIEPQTWRKLLVKSQIDQLVPGLIINLFDYCVSMACDCRCNISFEAGDIFFSGID